MKRTRSEHWAAAKQAIEAHGGTTFTVTIKGKRRDCARMTLRVPRTKYLRDSRGRFVSLMQMLRASLPDYQQAEGRRQRLEVQK